MRIERLSGTVKTGLRDSAGAEVTLVAQIYSPVMDLQTCDACARWDGERFPFDADGSRTPVAVPNRACTCEDGCRCVWTYVTDREV